MRHKPDLVDLRFDLYGKHPRHISTGDNEALWVTCGASSEVAGLFADGHMELFSTDCAPDQISRGTTTIWFTMPTGDSVGWIDADGKINTVALPKGSTPTGVATVDNDAWVTLRDTNQLAKVSTDGSATIIRPVVEGDAQLDNPAEIGGARFLAADERGSLWFTRSDLADIVRLDSDGTTESWTSPDCVDPWAISVGREAVWVTDAADGGGVWRIGRDEKLLQRVEPWPKNVAGSIQSDGAGGCWFSEEAEDLIAHLDVDAKLSEWDLSDYGERPRGIAVDTDGVAWVVLRTGGVVGVTLSKAEPEVEVADYTII